MAIEIIGKQALTHILSIIKKEALKIVNLTETVETVETKLDTIEEGANKPLRFETVLDTNYNLISTTCNYVDTIAALESGRLVYTTMVCEGVENGTMYPTEWKTQIDDPYVSFVYHFRREHEINEVWLHIRESGYNTCEWRILENSQMKLTYETGWQDVPDDEHYVSEWLLVDTFNNFQKLGDKTQDITSDPTSETKYPSVKAAADYTDNKCGVVLDYMQTTFATNIMALVADAYGPHIIYNDPTGFEATNSNVGEWQLNNLDLTPYKRLKFYVKASGDTNDNRTPMHIVEMHLDDRCKGSIGFTAGHMAVNPNNRNRIHCVTFAVNDAKTAIQFVAANSLYGTASTTSSGGRTCYLIEGYKN